jgi:hypothetical protein
MKCKLYVSFIISFLLTTNVTDDTMINLIFFVHFVFLICFSQRCSKLCSPGYMWLGLGVSHLIILGMWLCEPQF